MDDEQDQLPDLVPDELADEEIVEAPKPWWYRVGIVVLVVAIVLFLVPAVAHVFFPPINPAQPAPPGHFASNCWACHDVSAGVAVRSYD